MDMSLTTDWKDDVDLYQVMHLSNTGDTIQRPEILVGSFNPNAQMANRQRESSIYMVSREPNEMKIRRRLYSTMWYIFKRQSREISEIKLDNPIPIPHPLEIVMVIFSREAKEENDVNIDILKEKIRYFTKMNYSNHIRFLHRLVFSEENSR